MERAAWKKGGSGEGNFFISAYSSGRARHIMFRKSIAFFRAVWYNEGRICRIPGHPLSRPAECRISDQKESF